MVAYWELWILFLTSDMKSQTTYITCHARQDFTEFPHPFARKSVTVCFPKAGHIKGLLSLMPTAGLGHFWNAVCAAWKKNACLPRPNGPFSPEGQRENHGQYADDMAFVFHPSKNNLFITPGASLIYLWHVASLNCLWQLVTFQHFS